MNRPLIWGHRGASGYVPENTLEAFQLAVQMHAEGIELDIQQSTDGQIVVIHDEMIDRTSTGRGFVKDLTLDELRQYSYNMTFPEHKRCEIPLMSEVFELIRPTDLTINIELKTGVFDYESIEEKILAMTEKYGMEDRVIYSSFNHRSIKKIQKLSPSSKTAFLYSDGLIDMPAYGHRHHVDALHPWFVNLRYEGFMKQCNELGLEVNTWTVNEEEYIRMCQQYGVHAIITNYPDLALRIVRGEQ